MKDLLYEPRALWGVNTIDTADSTSPGNAPFRVLMNKGDFMNGSRYPIELTHLNVAAINYTFRSINTDDISSTTFRNDESVLTLLDIFIRAPKRMSFSPYDLNAITIPRNPTSNPGMKYSNAPYASSAFGISRWTFDRPFLTPRSGDILYQLGAWTKPSAVALGLQDLPDVSFSTCFFEEGYHDGGGRLNGNCRIKTTTPLRYGLGQQLQFPHGPFVSEPDRFGTFGNPGVSSRAGFPVEHEFTSTEYVRQETARGSKGNRVSGYSVHINQIDFDDALQESNIAWVPGTPITPISMRVGTQAKTRTGGTNEWWWRPGCPLALVSPTLTPALVHRFPAPITLGPGEGLEIELQVPGPVTNNNLSPPIELEPIYTFGISLTGYAVVEG